MAPRGIITVVTLVLAGCRHPPRANETITDAWARYREGSAEEGRALADDMRYALASTRSSPPQTAMGRGYQVLSEEQVQCGADEVVFQASSHHHIPPSRYADFARLIHL